jgi:uncharacterized protein (DUF1499 family)
MTIKRADAEHRRIVATQTTLLCRFVDDLISDVIDLGQGRSGLAVLSRSRVGYWDLGTNRRRVRHLLAQLARALDARPKAA